MGGRRSWQPQLVDAQLGADAVAAVVVEPIQGEGGDRDRGSRSEQRRERLAKATGANAWPELKATLTEADPFLINAALTSLKQPVFHPLLLAEVANPDAKIRLGCLLALRRAVVQAQLAAAP